MTKTIAGSLAAAVLCFLALCLPVSAWADAPVQGVTDIEAAEELVLSGVSDDVLSIQSDEPQGLYQTDDGGIWIQAISADTSWYSASASSFELTTPAQLVGLAELVNGGTTFNGKTVVLKGSVSFLNNQVVPIGTLDHPFEGTFDGGNNAVRMYTVSSVRDGQLTYGLGLFGVCGASSKLQNIESANAQITVTRTADETDKISCIGGIVGVTKGSISGLSSNAEVTVSSDVPQTASATLVVSKIGGVAGMVYRDVSDCSFAGKVQVTSLTAGSDAEDGNGRSTGLVVARDIAGVVGSLGDPVYEDGLDANNNPIKTTSDTHGTITNCSNSGSISTSTPSSAGVDRFGEAISARNNNVGGIVGYTQGSLHSCTNSGDVNGKEIDSGGGIVGNMRSITYTGSSDNAKQDSGSADDRIRLSNCVNTGSVNALHASGGLAGSAGSYTVIEYCSNSANVTGVRWNKPAVGGIAGQDYGDIRFCYNSGVIATATGGGYYVAGICGMFLCYKETDGTPTGEVPSMYSCYSTGRIQASAGMKSAGLSGQNEGTISRCVVLKGTVTDKDASGNDVLQVDDSSSGAVTDCSVMSIDDMKTKQCLAVMNAKGAAIDWADYFVFETGMNNGYPLLYSQSSKTVGTQLTSANVSATCTHDAAYSGGEAIPTVEVTFGGSQKLVQNVDYYVVPQAGATQLSGSTYQASIVGIGAYTGSVANVCSYKIVKGDLAECTVQITSKRFDYSEKNLDDLEIKVFDAQGNQLHSSWFTAAFKTSPYTGADDAYKGRSLVERYNSMTAAQSGTGRNWSNYAPQFSEAGVVHFGYYPVVLTAASAGNYTGSITGVFKVTPASLYNYEQDKVEIEAIDAQGKTYTWNSKDKIFKDGTPVLQYTGEMLRPTITRVTSNGHVLEEGVDYRVIYGNSNSDTDSRDNTTCDNVGTADGNALGCVTVRFCGISSTTPYDFDNYVNMYFTIHGTNAEDVVNIADCHIVAPDQPYTGSALSPVEVYAPDGTKLTGGSDYKVTYTNNTNAGTASFNITGVRAYVGTASGTFQIKDASDIALSRVTVPESILYDGTAKKPVSVKKYDGSALKEGVDYRIDYANNEQSGTASYSIVGLGAYSGTLSGTFQIVRFTDTSNDEWYTTDGWLDYVLQHNLMSGYANTTLFGPYDNVTRAQVATVLYRFANPYSVATNDPSRYSTVNTTGLSDVKVNTFYTAAVNWAVKKGIITGYKEGEFAGSFRPDAPVSRQEAATMIARFCSQYGQDITKFDTARYDTLKETDRVEAWAADYMKWCCYSEIITGVQQEDGYYLDPLGTTWRAAMAKIMTVVSRDVLAGASLQALSVDEAQEQATALEWAETHVQGVEALIDGAPAEQQEAGPAVRTQAEQDEVSQMADSETAWSTVAVEPNVLADGGDAAESSLFIAATQATASESSDADVPAAA